MGIPGNLHGIEEHLGDDACLFGVVAHCDQTHILYQQHLRRMATAGGVGFDGLFGLLRIGLHDEELAFAVYYLVGIERHGDRLGIREEMVDQRVARDLQGLQAASAARKHLADDGDEFRHAVRNPAFALGDGLHAGCEARHDRVVDAVDLLGGVGSHEDAVVLQENDLRLCAVPGLPVLDAVVHLLEEGVARVGIFDVECVGEELGAAGFGLP